MEECFFTPKHFRTEEMMNEERYMEMALELAEKGAGFVSPNPLVGEMCIRDRDIVCSCRA